MPVVHSSASALSTAGVLSGHGPSSNVSTTSLSRRKSSCLKCSKPNPGPPVVSISTVRPTPRAFGLLQAALAGCAGAGAGAGAALGAATGAGVPLAGGVCDHAALEANNETAPAKINPAAIRILFSSNHDPVPGSGFGRHPGHLCPNTQYPSWSGLAKATAPVTGVANRLIHVS